MATNAGVEEHLKLAVAAAASGDTRTFFLEIAASHAPDSIFGGLRRHWPQVEEGAIEAIVAEAVEKLYERIAVEHAVIGNVGAYLWGTAKNMLRRKHDAGVLGTVPLNDEIDLAAAAAGSEERDEDMLRAEALRRARALLPRLGLEVVRHVMAYIFDGVERGDLVLDNATIGAALGLTPSTVRRSKSRGFQRLKQAAQQEGFDMSGVLEANSDEDEEDEGDEK